MQSEQLRGKREIAVGGSKHALYVAVYEYLQSEVRRADRAKIRERESASVIRLLPSVALLHAQDSS